MNKYLKFNNLRILILLILLNSAASLNAQQFFLVNPSETCKAYLESSFKKFLTKKENLYLIEVLENDEGVSKITKYKNLEFAYTIQGIGARLIITKEKNHNTGLLTFLDENKPCNSIITLDKSYSATSLDLNKQSETPLGINLNENSNLPICSSSTAISIDHPIDLNWNNCFGKIHILDGKFKGWKYEGNFRKGKLHGFGSVSYVDGGNFIGEFQKGKKHGKGTMSFGSKSNNAGDKYIGEYREGKKHGHGIFEFSDGEKYDGEWKNNKRNGIGKNVWANGSMYIGGWKSNKQNGFGTFAFANGDRDVGQWSDNKLNGEAIQFYSDGSIYRQGVFKDDKFLYYKKVIIETEITNLNKTFKSKNNLNCDVGFEKIGNDCINKVFSDKLATALNKAQELEEELSKLKLEKEKDKQKINSDDKLPTISSLKYNYSDYNVTIEGIVSDNVEVVEVLINKQIVSFDSGGVFRETLYIPRNGKTINIVAFDLKGNKAIKTIHLQRKEIDENIGPFFEALNPTGKISKVNKNSLALIVGIAKYEKTSAEAIYADNDAQMFYDYARFRLGIPTSNIKELINENAEESEILLAVKDWIGRTSKKDKSDIFIFFAGHGMASNNGENMYLLPYDGSPRLLEDSAISRNRLFKEVASYQPRSVSVFFDTCFSGSTRDTDTLLSARPVLIVPKEKPIPENFTLFSAAAADQIANPLKEVQHGLFSYFLMKGMEGDADQNNDNLITTGELHSYVQRNVMKHSLGSQTPELHGDHNKVLLRIN